MSDIDFLLDFLLRSWSGFLAGLFGRTSWPDFRPLLLSQGRNDMSKPLSRSKRKFMRLALLAIAAAMTAPEGLCALEGEKQSKAAAGYQDSPKGIQSCATCTLFEAPRACKVVEGDVSPSGWCKAYAMAD
jgi:hypothetical protein